MKIGVLALQGGFAEHVAALGKLGVENFLIRKMSDLDNGIDALILPGGESTVIGKLLHETGLFYPIKHLIDSGLPVFGTCAGMILLSGGIENEDEVYFGSIPIRVKRNAFGRQLGSFQTIGFFADIGEIPMTFIRAPVISKTSEGVIVLATVKGQAVAAEWKNILVTAFHPELTADCRFLSYFLKKLDCHSV
ncbi:pyridoxal 5'-phosphate synthase, glutaminase subunit Pdx2 [Sphaerochaeta pleomorpha str. Grapes]|uniref:Pyridoxal 5'-phosphate synthase subunit PdxT n=1 Tax=Sphaerochaeta pleomorpha (strain ATCC BAA-1885 / DSM 22778 / Grapes) TaxID=158190 RepID=G8QYY7_SPHPG|nr:pyridoxal 5'-phosphate synthase glutaminase subunit PdxT [Sphaerochaeta pleomorpha]AEV30846.1 pyridoxal 5'-phosphate synthase, glutaminase subunit Pdx2 [Sphaerochaeta pleomorpha str. Grapes]